MAEGKFQQAILRLSRLLQQYNEMFFNDGVNDAGDARHTLIL